MAHLITDKVDKYGRTIIQIEDGPFSGVCFVYDKVELKMDIDTPILSFSYLIQENSSVSDDMKDEFEHQLGQILEVLLSDMLGAGSVVFYGGTNEIRKI